MNKILRRVLIIAPAVLLELFWLFVLFELLAPWTVAIDTVLTVLAFLLVLYLVIKQDESTYKIIWLLVILTFPLGGALLYLVFGNKRTTRPLKRKMDKTPPLPKDEADTARVYDALSADNKRLAQTFRYLENKTGFVPHLNCGAKYYSLGDKMFPCGKGRPGS